MARHRWHEYARQALEMGVFSWLVLCLLGATLVVGCQSSARLLAGDATPDSSIGTRSTQSAIKGKESSKVAPAAATKALERRKQQGVSEDELEEGVVIGPAKSFDNLTVFPVLAKSQPDLGKFTTLHAALAKLDAEVREVGAGAGPTRRGDERVLLQSAQSPQQMAQNATVFGGEAAVNTLVVENKGEIPIYVLAGTVVKGGKQDRQIGQDFVIDPHSTVSVDAFCVEHGRWTATRAGVATQGKFSAVRALATAKVRAAGQYQSDQGTVWAEVGKVNDANKKSASSGTLMATLDDEAIRKEQDALSERVAQHLGSVTSVRDIVGLAYAVDGEIRGLRWFANHQLFELFEDTLVNTAAVDAITTRGGEAPKPAPAVAPASVKRFVTEMDSTGSQRSAETPAENINDYAESTQGYRSETKLKAKAGASSTKVISKDYLKK